MDIEDPKVFIKERGIYEIKELKVVGKHQCRHVWVENTGHQGLSHPLMCKHCWKYPEDLGGLFYAEYEGMKAAKKGNWPRVVFWAKRWLKLRSDKKGGKND